MQDQLSPLTLTLTQALFYFNNERKLTRPPRSALEGLSKTRTDANGAVSHPLAIRGAMRTGRPAAAMPTRPASARTTLSTNTSGAGCLGELVGLLASWSWAVRELAAY